ncbi:MAG: DpnII family type II restriction endonuclease [Promethearchaeota archaeon]
MDKDKKYIKFASTLCFFEFNIQEEFKEPQFKVSEYKEEINELNKLGEISKDKLISFLEDYPRVFDIFEQIFQLYKFTNAQLFHFFFNVKLLNSTNKEKTVSYLLENFNKDDNFKTLFLNCLKKNNIELNEIEEINNFKKEKIIKIFKETINNYIKSMSKKKSQIYSRINVDETSRLRFADYLIVNLKIKEVLESINLEVYLKNKRIPKDTKSIHGKFGTIKIEENLVGSGYINANGKFKELEIKEINVDLTNIPQLSEFKDKKVFITEKYVKNILNKETKKRKRFDFLLIEDLKLKCVIETNFYSTSGSKIGINEKEYIPLNKEIEINAPGVEFLWITDGNYWLTKGGEDKFKMLIDHFGDNILNYNLFKEKITQ